MTHGVIKPAQFSTRRLAVAVFLRLCMTSFVTGINTCPACHVFTCTTGKPVISELQSVRESRGMTATLLCRSYGHPAPSVTFRRLQPLTATIYRSGRLYVSYHLLCLRFINALIPEIITRSVAAVHLSVYNKYVHVLRLVIDFFYQSLKNLGWQQFLC